MTNLSSSSENRAYLPQGRRSRFGAITLAYAAFVAYGSLVPLAFRARPLDEAWYAFLHLPYLQLGIHSRADWVANILLYIPLAFLVSGWLAGRVRPAGATALTFVLCGMLTLAVEFAQLFFPPRTASLNDLIAQCFGTAIGSVIWLRAGERLVLLWNDVQHGGRQGTRAFMVLYTTAYLAFALFPYDFVFTEAELAEKLYGSRAPAFLLNQSCGAALGCAFKFLAETLVAAPLGILIGMVAGRHAAPSLLRAFGWGVFLGLTIEGLQTFLASGVAQGASVLTRGFGMAAGLAVYRFLRREWLIEYRAHVRFLSVFALPLYVVLLLAMNGFFTSELQTLSSALRELARVRFLPFYYHYYTTETEATYSVLIHAGAYAPIGFFVWIMRDHNGGREALWASGIAAFLLAAGMEILKLFLADKRPDPTDALIAAASAALACYAAQRLTHREVRRLSEPMSSVRRQSRHGKRPWAVALALLLAVLAIAGWIAAMHAGQRVAKQPASARAEGLDTRATRHFDDHGARYSSR